MAGQKDFFDGLHDETMLVMAENFFSRRKEMDEWLECFSALAGEVRAAGTLALGYWRTLLLLLADGGDALKLLEKAGMDAPALVREAGAQEPARMTIPFALTVGARHRKSVRRAYLAARQATLSYLEGTCKADPSNPARKIVTPNYCGLRDLAEKINKEARMLNSGMSPSSMLAYVKSLDPAEVERESHAGGFTGEDMGGLDRDMAVKSVDFEGLGLPVLACPAPLEEMGPALDAAARSVLRERRPEAIAALKRVSGR